METTNNSFWLRIQQGLREAEKLMSQKQYNMAMIKARQTLEYMVNFLGEKALIVEGDLADSIDQLFEGRFISHVTKDHYHRIRVLGNKAVHEGDDSPYDANEACQLLSQEVQAFANSFHKGKPTEIPSRQSPSAVKPLSVTSRHNGVRNEAQRTGSSRNSCSRTAPRTGDRPDGIKSGCSRSNTARTGQRPSQRNGSRTGHRSSSPSRSRRRSKKKGVNTYGLLKPMLIFLVLLVIVLIIVKLIPGKDDKKETTAATTTAEVTTEAMTTTEAPTLPPEPETEAPKIYTTKKGLNVRSEPSTSGTLLGTLHSGTVVDFVEAYDDKWTTIMYNGKQAYVSSEYLTVSEGVAETTSNDVMGTTAAAESSSAAEQ